MKKTVIGMAACMTFSVALMSTPVAHADQALAQSKGCLACHQMDNKVVGPALKEISAKYQGDAGAAEMLAAKVKSGGVGTWGQIPMPPQVAASEAEIKTLVAWMLSL